MSELLTQLNEKIKAGIAHLQEDMDKVVDNKQAAKRARLATRELSRLFKEFRKESSTFDKSKPKRVTPAA